MNEQDNEELARARELNAALRQVNEDQRERIEQLEARADGLEDVASYLKAMRNIAWDAEWYAKKSERRAWAVCGCIAAALGLALLYIIGTTWGV